MAHTMQLEIVSAENALFSGIVEWISATGEAGEVGIYPGHTQLLTALKPGQIIIKKPEGGEEVFYMSGGMLEVQPDVVTILADTAERASDLDEAAAIAAQEKAEAQLQDQESEVQYTAAMQELVQAAAQIRAIKLLRERMKH